MLQKQMKWSRGFTNKDRYQLDPTNIEGKQDLEEPIDASDLFQFSHCLYRRATVLLVSTD